MDALFALARSVDFLQAALALLAVFALRWALRAQKADDFDWGGAFKDATGKVSGGRLAQVGCFVLMSWAFCYITVRVAHIMTSADDVVKILQVYSYLAMGYAALFSGAKIIETIAAPLIAKWAGVKGPQ